MKQQSKRSSASFDPIGLLKCLLCGVVCFYLGISQGWNMNLSCECGDVDSKGLRAKGTFMEGTNAEMAKELKDLRESVQQHEVNEGQWMVQLNNMKNMLQEQEEKMKSVESKEETRENDDQLKKNFQLLADKVLEQKEKIEEQKAQMLQMQNQDGAFHKKLFINRHVGSFAGGMTFVDRDDFSAHFDIGVPIDESGWGNDLVVMLYSDPTALPSEDAKYISYPRGAMGLSVEDATKNCRNLHVVLDAVSRKQQCVALMGQYESFHVQKFMRMSDGPKQSDRNIDMNLPLRYVNRNMMLNGEKSISIPNKQSTEAFWKIVTKYLNSITGALDELRPIAKSVASNNSHNTIVVMVCNYGHSEMLMNFVCNAHAKGEETRDALKSILIFATDTETHKLAQGLGLSSFYNQEVFGDVPAQAAEEYGDSRYSQIMMAKIYCVHLISQLGYDLLFQDVDIVWYKNPIPFFHNESRDENNFSSMDWDMIFQDDGARNLFFAPYSANTGFYFVRSNIKTQYFFNQMLMMGDMILSTGSHQSALIVLLVEQASLHGLRIKTWNRMKDEFPGGHAYHQRKDFMKKLVLGKNSTEGRGLIESADENSDGVDPYLFHMSWTLNKENKLKYFEQMGEWYLNEQCNTGSDKLQTEAIQNPSINNCCAAKPLVKCHFKDKPSMIPCPDAPSIDKHKTSFW